jgi:hypothetical protein
MSVQVVDINSTVCLQRLGNPYFSTDTYWDKGSGTPWTISGGKANAVAATGDLTQANVLVAGIPYRVIWNVDTATAGGVRLKLGTVLGTNRTTPGIYTEDITPDGTDLAVVVTGGAFTGSIEQIEAFRLKDTFTVPGIGTPKAAILAVSFARIDIGVDVANASLGIGMTDGTRQVCTMGSSLTAEEVSKSRRRISNTFAIGLLKQADGTIRLQGSVALIADGVEITWTTVSEGHFVSIRLLLGTSLQTYVGTFTSPLFEGGIVAVTAPGWEPDQLFVTSNLATTAIGTTGNGMNFSIGFASNHGGVVTQCSNNFKSNDNVGTTQTFNRQGDDSIGWLPNDSTFQFDVISFDATGFTIDAIANGAAVCTYMALKYNGAVKHWTGTIELPTGSGNQATTAPGIRPQAVFLIGTPSIVGTGGGDATLAFSMFNRNTERTILTRDRTNVGTSETSNMAADKAIRTMNGANSVNREASFVSFNSTGWTANYTTTGIAAMCPTMVIGEFAVKDVIMGGVIARPR